MENPSMDICTQTGGDAYIPPAKLCRIRQQEISDNNSEQYQQLAWETLKKSINGLINKVSVDNIDTIGKELFEINLIRGRGVLVRLLIRAQCSSPSFTNVYAALVAVCNAEFPKIGELLLKRLIIQFKQFFERNDKTNCINTTRFIAHLVNQQIAHEVIALEMLILLLENPTNDSVEVAIAFLKECGSKLEDVSSKCTTAIFDSLRNIWHDGEQIDQRVQHMIEVIFSVRRNGFIDYPTVLPELDLIEEDDQTTHLITLDEDELDSDDRLNFFQFDEKFQENEDKYETIKNDILDADGWDDDLYEMWPDSNSDYDEDDDEDTEDEEDVSMIIDNRELIGLRKIIYLTIESSTISEECAHRLLKLELPSSQYPELCRMIVDCCAEQRTYLEYYGLLAQRFCELNQDYVETFKDIFEDFYETLHHHRFEKCKLRNVAKLYAHLLHTGAIPWTVLAPIRLTELDTNSSNRVLIKILFQQLAKSLGLIKLNALIKDETLNDAFKGLFPRDNQQSTRFAVDFFTNIGLGDLTDDLCEHLENPSTIAAAADAIAYIEEEFSSDSSDSFDDLSLSSFSSSSSNHSHNRRTKSNENEDRRSKSNENEDRRSKSNENEDRRSKSNENEDRRSKSNENEDRRSKSNEIEDRRSKSNEIEDRRSKSNENEDRGKRSLHRKCRSNSNDSSGGSLNEQNNQLKSDCCNDDEENEQFEKIKSEEEIETEEDDFDED